MRPSKPANLGQITIYCLDGRIAFTTGGKTHDLKAGHWLFLLGNEPHSLVAVEDASVLLTMRGIAELRARVPYFRRAFSLVYNADEPELELASPEEIARSRALSFQFSMAWHRAISSFTD